MGNTESNDQNTHVKQLGDQQVTIIENQQISTQLHNQHDIKLWIILFITSALLILKLVRMMWKCCKKQTLKALSTANKVQNV